MFSFGNQTSLSPSLIAKVGKKACVRFDGLGSGSRYTTNPLLFGAEARAFPGGSRLARRAEPKKNEPAWELIFWRRCVTLRAAGANDMHVTVNDNHTKT